MADCTTHRTFCRICIAACGLLVGVDGDEVVSVRSGTAVSIRTVGVAP